MDPAPLIEDFKAPLTKPAGRHNANMPPRHKFQGWEGQEKYLRTEAGLPDIQVWVMAWGQDSRRRNLVAESQ